MNTFGTGYWDLILSILVTFHVIIEFIHYGHEYLSAKREKNILKDIQKHRKLSNKTKQLIKIQEDIILIKNALNIKEK